jgi:luciferase-like monooxygenase
MTPSRTASHHITDEVAAWPGVDAGPGRRGEFAFKVGRHEIGHLHGDRAAHFGLGKDLGESLRERGMVVDHPVFPGKPAMAARGIDDQHDVDEVIELMRINYDRIVARYGLPEPSAA